MDKPLFSIVIPTYNRAKLLERCLKSVISQTYTNWEAIIVDNYSEDNTEEIVKSFADSRIRYIKNHNFGVIAISRNKAIDMAHGDWICFLDSDDIWYKEKLESLLPYINDYDIIYHGYKLNTSIKRFFKQTNVYFYTIKEVSIPYVLKRGDPINPSCSALSSNFLGNSRFSEEEKLIAIEDYDFFLQLILKKPRIKHLRKILTVYDASTGCSHTRSFLDRSRIIYNKYSSFLSKSDLREVLRLYMWSKGCFFYNRKEYSMSRYYFSIAASSKIFKRKIQSNLAIIKSFVLQYLNK